MSEEGLEGAWRGEGRTCGVVLGDGVKALGCLHLDGVDGAAGQQHHTAEGQVGEHAVLHTKECLHHRVRLGGHLTKHECANPQ
eukprot:4689268-Pyramimonas_sp.AAC.1